MDTIDRKILAFLQENARISNTEIAKQIGMVPSGVLERIKKLEKNGHIQEYTVRLNPESLNLGLVAFIFVSTDDPTGNVDTAKRLAEFQEVMEVHHVAGEDCYLIKVRLPDNKSLAEFMREKLGKLVKISSTRTIIVLETIKETSRVSFPITE